MKKALLIITCLLLIVSVSAQSKKFEKKSTKTPNVVSTRFQNYKGDPVQQSSADNQRRTEIIDGRSITYIPIGSSPNVSGFASSPRTFLWADPVNNSVSFIYDIYNVTDTIDIGYNLSFDGGATWSSDQKVNVGGYKGMNVQGGIINPDASSDPDDSFFTYFAQASDGSNGPFGGYIYGSNVLSDTANPSFSYEHSPSNMVFFRTFSDAFTITPEGTAWYVGGNYRYLNPEYEFNGQLIIGKGEVVDNEISYTESMVDFLEQGDEINDIKVAFSPDGQIGYICVMTDSDSEPIQYTNYHPVLLKTTDGGNTWSNPIHLQLGGLDGIETIKYYWSDEILESIDVYGPGFNRDQVYYNLGYSCDIIVDMDGNPHITGIIAIASEDGWFPAEGSMATWHLYSEDGGTIWGATALYDNIFFEGDLDGENMFNRPYAASTGDGSLLFFSWIDTDLDGAEGNTNPNLFLVGYDAYDNIYTAFGVDNVTELSLYWFSAFFGSMSQYIFSDGNGCEIPFVFCEFLEPVPPFGQIQYRYIDGYSIPCYVTVEEYLDPGFGVTQNSPNPASDMVTISVSSNLNEVIELEIFNALGQKVHTQLEHRKAHVNNFYVNVCNFEPGLYVYTIRIGNNSKRMKMLVR
jgi:type IX secretion system substrate protein